MPLRLAIRARLPQHPRKTQFRGGEPGGEGEHLAILVLRPVEISKLFEVDLPKRTAGEHFRSAASRGRTAQDPHGRLGIGRAQLQRGPPDLGKDLRVNIRHRRPSYHVAGARSAK